MIKLPKTVSIRFEFLMDLKVMKLIIFLCWNM
jgi:hypothetical protein